MLLLEPGDSPAGFTVCFENQSGAKSWEPSSLETRLFRDFSGSVCPSHGAAHSRCSHSMDYEAVAELALQSFHSLVKGWLCYTPGAAQSLAEPFAPPFSPPNVPSVNNLHRAP